jgi:membrane protein YqaA with SNARE-associated domain
MGGFVNWIQGFALELGGPGLFIVACLDSSFVSLPEINDILLVWMVTRDESRMLYYAACSTLGSIAGCLMLYLLGRKGDQWVMSKFHPERIERTMGAFRKYGLLAVLVPSLLPPPAPFKVFVLLSGIAGIRPGRFVSAIAIGRGVRYFGEGLLAVWYGDRAIEFLRENGRSVAFSLTGALVAGIVAYGLWTKLRRARTPVNY